MAFSPDANEQENGTVEIDLIRLPKHLFFYVITVKSGFPHVAERFHGRFRNPKKLI